MRTCLSGLVFASILAAGSGCRSAGEKGPAADPGLRGYWAFDEGAGAVAKNAVSPQHGHVPAGLAWVEGRKGKALLFNGKDFVTVRNHECLNAPQYTFAAWTKLKDTGDHHYIVWKAGPEFPEAKNARRYDLWTDTDGTVHGIVHDEKEGEEHFSGATNVADNKWHHVALTYDGKGLKLYVDGKVEADVKLAAPLAKNAHDLWIGGRPEGVVATGVLDEVRFYARALSGAEVAALAAP